MTTEAKIQLTSSELGTMWMTYISGSALIIKCKFMKDKTIDKEAQNILSNYITDAEGLKDKIVNLFNSENVIIPIGFDERDMFKEAPSLFDDIFKIMNLRQLMKLNFSHSAIFTAMSYMKEVHDILKLNYDIADKYYVMTTNYLLKKGVLAKSPYVTFPKKVEFIEDKKYMSGINPFSDKRALNTIEVGFLNEIIEDNIFGMQLMTGFAQVATESEVKEYFIEGKELAKKIISKLSDVLSQSDILPPSTWAGKATDSTQPPYSDKLMMYTTSLMSGSALTFSVSGTSYSLRNDLPLKLALIGKEAFTYAKKGGKLMIKHKWMEEPPQMEDRNQLIKN
ncbi:DUF3231 family protein [uncultured Clostridium sp.]|uniref:DUF3231 family protein n=1 Tax=uncultured Clostridium sp. TaxID=59620 RepID=UPI00261E3F3D|nr:DUF3231 family protein [uncultured Clostridium sp.]